MNNLRVFSVIFLCVVTLFLTGCFGGRPTGYFKEETAITTRGGFGENGVFHDIIYNPEAIALNFPGYIVALDKGRHHAVGVNAIYPEKSSKDQPGIRRVKERMRSDPKMHYISHIVRNEGNLYGKGNCLLYTMYSQWGNSDADAGDAPANMCAENLSAVGKSQTAQIDSWKALELFATELQQAIVTKKSRDGHSYTHVIVVSMGWNTPQIEAIQNFNSIISHLKTASGTSRFEPLFVGITWPSVWSSKWLDPLIKIASYKAKANDADEVGTIWITEIIDLVKLAAPRETVLVGIGHSFGARAMFSSICSAGVWGKEQKTNRKWNTLIGWQSAFSINRFIYDENRFTNAGFGDGFRYANGCLDKVDTIILTSSANDEAINTAFWADMTGSHDQWEAVCGKSITIKLDGKTNCVPSDAVRGSNLSSLTLKHGHINYIDVSQIVFFSQPNTGGGAHSDIYRAVHGKLNWKAIVTSQ